MSDSVSGRTLKARLARYMDPQAFTDSVSEALFHTAPTQAKVKHDKLKFRREVGLKRADAAIRFFMMPENAQAIEARRAATGNTDAVHESAVATPCAQNTPSPSGPSS